MGYRVRLPTGESTFWERLYPQVRRELARRDPRHRWPEDHGSTSTVESGRRD